MISKAILSEDYKYLSPLCAWHAYFRIWVVRRGTLFSPLQPGLKPASKSATETLVACQNAVFHQEGIAFDC
jgi:hypothetical protein